MRLISIMTLCLICTSALPANIVAHYPLEVLYRLDKPIGSPILVLPYDVSGYGRHGNTFNLGNADFTDSKNALFDKYLGYVSFLGSGFTCVSKATNADAYITIPNLPDYTSVGNSQAVSFWLYWKSEQAGTRQTILSTNNLVVHTNGLFLELDYLSSPDNFARVGTSTHSTVFGSEGWYHIGVSIPALGGEPRAVVYEYTSEQLHTFPFAESYGPAYRPTSSRILSDSFKGSLAHVRFYDYALDETAFAEINEADCDLTSGDVSGESFMVRNAFDYLPLGNGQSGPGHADEIFKNISPFINRTPTPQGAYSLINDRFGRPAEAVDLNHAQSYVAMPSFLAGGLANHNPFSLNTVKGFTISLWVYIEGNLSSPVNTIQYPFTNSDPRISFFAGVDGTNKHLLGMQQVNDRVGLYRYTRIDNTVYPWYLWLYDPLSFRNKPAGWYHLVYAQAGSYAKVYIWDQLNACATCQCGLDGNSACACQYLYMELQNLDNITQWGLGSLSLNTVGPKGIDDFRVYNWPLSDMQAQALHKYESTPPASRSSPTAREKQATVPSVATQEETGYISVFPNPSDGEVNIAVTAKAETPMNVQLYDLQGRLLFETDETLKPGANQFMYKRPNGSRSGHFMLKVCPGGVCSSYKILIR